jgi:hypothetical protein
VLPFIMLCESELRKYSVRTLGTSEGVSRLISETGEGMWTRTSDRPLGDGADIQVMLAVLFHLAVI